MQASVEQQQAKYNVGQIDAQLQAVGKALALAEAMAEAGKALSSNQLEKAAEELEKLDMPQLDRQTEKAIKEKLDALARQMEDSGSSSPSAVAGDLSKGLGGDGTRFKQGLKRLAKDARSQSKRKRLTNLLKEAVRLPRRVQMRLRKWHSQLCEGQRRQQLGSGRQWQ